MTWYSYSCSNEVEALRARFVNCEGFERVTVALRGKEEPALHRGSEALRYWSAAGLGSGCDRA